MISARDVAFGSFAIWSCPVASSVVSLRSESGSKFRASCDTSIGYCGLMALPETCFKLLNWRLGSCATNSAISNGRHQAVLA
jgi:hypothetical protein